MNQILWFKRGGTNRRKAINIPSSKSILIRLLFMLFFSKEKIILKNFSCCEDVLSMITCLRGLGKKIKCKDSSLTFKKHNKNSTKKKLYVGSSGLTARIIFMYLLVKKEKKILLGSKEIYRRPVKDIEVLYKDIVDNINSKVFYKNDGFLPLKTISNRNVFVVRNRISSQFVTALLLNLHVLNKEIKINISKVVSKEYIYMTVKILREFGLNIKRIKEDILFKKSKLNFKKKYSVEPDCSSASYFFLISIFEKGIFFKKSIVSKVQKEINFLNVLKKIGLRIFYIKKKIFLRFRKKKIYSISIDCKSIIDSSMSLCLLFLSGIKRVKLYNIYNWNLKECKRIDAISKECKVLGMRVKKSKNWIIFSVFKNRHNIIFKNYNDHRICMTFSLLLKKRNILISNPNSVKKTFPSFFNELNV
ncbi:3-phosphoshikimate 1-carboxyvinyltransferase [Candidatus Vidania fulgoroideae]|nr:3-phosphoshikimate 1-carboxyvinyltransferase [Candidatus Vidania fulgoroideae]